MRYTVYSNIRNLVIAMLVVFATAVSGVAQTESATPMPSPTPQILNGQELKMPIVERASETADGKHDQYRGKKVTITGAIVVAGKCNRFTGKCEDPTYTQNGVTIIAAEDWYAWIANNSGEEYVAIRFIVEPGKLLKVQLPAEGMEELKSLYMRFGRETTGVTTAINAVFKSRVNGGVAQNLANVMWLRAANESSVTHWQTSLYADGLELGESNNLGKNGAKIWTPGQPNTLDFTKVSIFGKEYEETFLSYITLPDYSRHNSVVVTIEFYNNTNANAMLTVLGGAQIVPQR